jgi:hypothetical protein
MVVSGQADALRQHGIARADDVGDDDKENEAKRDAWDHGVSSLMVLRTNRHPTMMAISNPMKRNQWKLSMSAEKGRADHALKLSHIAALVCRHVSHGMMNNPLTGAGNGRHSPRADQRPGG